MNENLLERHVSAALSHRLGIMPAVVVTGARQTGKTTLVRRLTPGPRRFVTLDDLDTLDLAKRDPASLVESVEPLTIDEVQREPALLHAVKMRIDAERRPGHYLITGSANLLLSRAVSESLAGRASYLTLWPLTHREQAGEGRAGLWDTLLSSPPADWSNLLASQTEGRDTWHEFARRGGFPTPALELSSAEDRAVWFDGYTRTYLERDLQDLSRIQSLPDFRRLMRASALRIGQLLNQTEIARDIALPQPTVHRWLNLLELSYLVVNVPAYAVNRTKRIVKRPKLYWGDTGLAMFLAGLAEPTGHHLENLVLCDLLAWRDARLERPEVHYWRTTLGEEVDFVVEVGDTLLPIEVKATTRPRLNDTLHLRTFRREYPEASLPGLLLHAGSTVEWLSADVLAAPWWAVM